MAFLAGLEESKNATVVKYTAETFVLNTSDHWEKVSLNSFSFSSDAFSLSGSFFGPAMPALVIKRLIQFPRFLISLTRFSRSSLLVTSQGPMLEVA